MMVKIQIDRKFYDVQPGKNLLDTCLTVGIYIPHFCYHAALGSVGACRLCAVKKYASPDDMNGRIIMSCMEPVMEGLIVSVNDPDSKAFRAAIIESLMTNHPHDCPVCDEGGECHLQDMTVMTGHNYRRFDFKKRTYKNQFLGPFLTHEMNRCIQCYRCVRFYADYAGGKDLSVFGSHNHVYFGRHQEGILENEFSGNLAEVCPTGVFTDKTLKDHYTRKWDLTNAPSICVHCGVGCNTIAAERYGGLRRIMSRYNGAVNGYFLCDRGRFGYEFVNDDQRIRKAQIRISKGNDLEETDSDTLVGIVSAAFSGIKKCIGIGSPRASLEANFALSCLVGKENFYHGVSRKEHALVKTAIDILQNGTGHSPSLKEIEKADTVLILGEDITNTAPMVALAVRQAARNKGIEMAGGFGIPKWNDSAQRAKAQDLKSPVFIASPFNTKLDDVAERTFRASNADIARLGFAVASLINEDAPSIKDLDKEQQELAQRIADTLKGAKSPLIICGIHGGTHELIHSAANITLALSLNGNQPSLCFLVPECNSMGLGMMEGQPFEDAVGRITSGDVETLVILENDLYRRAEKTVVDLLFEKCKNIVVLDHPVSETTLKADILLPVGTFAESEGTFVNNEGRAQRFYRVLPPNGSIIESWRQISDLSAIRMGKNTPTWNRFDDLVREMTDTIPVFSKIKGHVPDADFRLLNEKIKRQTIRFSGRTAMNANIAVSEPKPPQDIDSPLAFSMEGSEEIPPSSLLSYYWVPGWNSYQAVNFYLDEPNGSLKGGDPGIRLIDDSDENPGSFFDLLIEPYTKNPGEWLILPVYQIFGSEELSSKGRTIAGQVPQPFILISGTDALRIGKKEKDQVKLTLNQKIIEAEIRIEDGIPPGIAGLSVGLPGMQFLDMPGFGIIQ